MWSHSRRSYAAGSTVTFTARPAAGWEFVGWGGSATGTTNPMSLTMNENKSVLATFEKTVDPISTSLRYLLAV